MTRNPTPSARATADDLDRLPWAEGAAGATHTGVTGRRCSRHRWAADVCSRCGHVRDESAARRGKSSRRRGNDMEREVAHVLGGKRVGQFGTLVDVEAGPFLIQVKAGGRFPGWIADILAGMPVTATTRRVLAVFDSPGPGRPRRGLVCELWGDWADEVAPEITA